VFTALEVTLLHDNEVAFVQEYCSVMQPLALALDMLQAENKCYIGFLLPTLTFLECKPSVKLTGPLIDAILSALGTRFAANSDRSELIIATVTLPQFRLRWLDKAKKAAAHSLMYEYATAVQQQTATTSQDTDNVSRSASREDDFCFEAQPAENTDAQTEVDMFLADTSRDIHCLNRYPVIQKLFLQYNTALPSSVPVERLFSLGGQILTLRVQNFGDLATFSVVFCILYAECPPYFYFRFVRPTDLESIPHASTLTSIIPTTFEAPTPIRS